ncbi:Transcriptional regulatory protein pro1 [Zalerion maritima]|uniref:Transcriptional regulatory protein pro1 n=1 Tax=Zalerion maritima TaxID=339359 RepID=A0AAD5RP99_9PEZI|nr:Transcriptional regulatory protein pro1 [Zalerion maritima]
MSTLPPNHREDLMRTAPVNMAVAATTKPKPASKASSNNASSKAKAQMHRRSRTGCYTCRLRRKKCDEGTPMCTACKHLGLQCEYKRPMWWSNNDARRNHKENIKMIIKSKKLSEKSSHTIQTSASSPPGLSHSLPTSATLTDPFDRTRSASMDSLNFNFNSPPHTGEFFPNQLHPDFMFSGGFSQPYEVDVKTERQMFVNDVPTLRESHTSTFSTYQTPPPTGAILPSFNPVEGGEWTEQIFQERKESLTEESLNVNYFDFNHSPSTQVAIELDEGDQKLLEHFIQFVLPTIFPILESNQHGSVGSDLILPALQNNKGYLHCCLSIAAQHLKSTLTPDMIGSEMDRNLDNDIMKHRYETIASLCDALNKDENHQQILDAALGLIFFQCGVGRFDDTLPDIPWHQHFQAAISLVQKLDLPRLVTESSETVQQTPFNMTLTSWIDIIGATMQGRAPIFAHTYREKHLSTTNQSLGLRELMGCDDRVMYLISEIACLENLKLEGMDEMIICQHIHSLAEQIGLTEQNDPSTNAGPKMPFNANGTLSPKQLSRNITMAFRLAARIYLCSLVPGFVPSQSSCVGLVDKLAHVLSHIPSGIAGYDRSLSWVFLTGGAVAAPGSQFRTLFEDRIAQLGDLANHGSFGRVVCLLRETWAQQAALSTVSTPVASPGENGEQASSQGQQQQHISWRDVMRLKDWDFLLM